VAAQAGVSPTAPPASYGGVVRGDAICFPDKTDFCISGRFRQYWEQHGNLPINGYPLSDEFVQTLEDGKQYTVQYFERVRMEYHPEFQPPHDVLLGQFGRRILADVPNAPTGPVPPRAGARHFPETGHTVSGGFLDYWQATGGLEQYGFPLSEVFTQRLEDGREYEVQYFERARFEYHPDLPPAYQVLLGHLGRRYLAQHTPPDWAREPVPNAEVTWAAVRPTRVVIPRIEVDAPVSEAGFSLGEWDVPRYTAAHYWPVAAYPGTQGNTIIAGHAGYKDTLFYHLPKIVPGDEILVYVGDQPHRYIAREVLTLLPDQTWVMLPTSTETLTLITCVPLRVYSHRLVVRAEPAPQ
jgi:LPXTG-site transpeptidase (sortase) family protein